MDFYEVIEKRRTIRKFQGTAKKGQLDRIIAAGAKAPSRRGTQNWEVFIIDDPELLEKISEVKYQLNRDPSRMSWPPPNQEKRAQLQKDSFANASLLMVYFKKLPQSWMVPFDLGSAYLFIENISLAAIAEGMGSRIATFWGGAEKEINKLLKVPENWELVAAVSIGVPAMGPEPKKLRPQKQWLHRNCFSR